MAIDGHSGSVYLTAPGYDEPPRRTGNRSQTDYQPDTVPDDTRYRVFRDRRVRDVNGLRVTHKRSRRG